MLAAALPYLIQALPQLISTGFDVYQLATHVNAHASPTTPVETFASQVFAALPAAIAGGKDVKALVENGAAAVKLMIAENRAPTDQEKADQTARLAALDADFDKAAAPRP